jgi:hypothetical protein
MSNEKIQYLEDLRKSAKDRKKYLKALLKNIQEQHRRLAQEYDLVKKEIKIIDDRIEQKISESEFSQYLDTVRLEIGELKLLRLSDE